MTLIAFSLLIALYLVNEQRRRQKLKVDSAVRMLATLLMDKKNERWLSQYKSLVELNTPCEGFPINKYTSKELRSQVSVLVKALKLVDDRGL